MKINNVKKNNEKEDLWYNNSPDMDRKLPPNQHKRKKKNSKVEIHGLGMQHVSEMGLSFMTHPRPRSSTLCVFVLSRSSLGNHWQAAVTELQW